MVMLAVVSPLVPFLLFSLGMCGVGVGVLCSRHVLWERYLARARAGKPASMDGWLQWNQARLIWGIGLVLHGSFFSLVGLVGL